MHQKLGAKWFSGLVKFRFSKRVIKIQENLPKLFEFCKGNVKSSGRFCQLFMAVLEKLNCTRYKWIIENYKIEKYIVFNGFFSEFLRE